MTLDVSICRWLLPSILRGIGLVLILLRIILLLLLLLGELLLLLLLLLLIAFIVATANRQELDEDS